MKQIEASWPLNSVDKHLIQLALQEDLGQPFCDITTRTLFSGVSVPYRTRIVSKASKPLVVCGLNLASSIYDQINPHCQVKTSYQDGDYLAPGETLLTVTGDAVSLLQGERIVLNFLQRLCAVATLTAQYVDRVKNTKMKVLDTRKTTPGFRHLEKYAVHCGGGVNHRLGLYDALMIKDNHIDLLGGMQAMLHTLPVKQGKSVILEVRSLEELRWVLDQGVGKVDRVLLDNMNVDQLHACVVENNGQFDTEASGNITLDNIVEVAQTGVDFASVGALTHSAGSVDLSMQVVS